MTSVLWHAHCISKALKLVLYRTIQNSVQVKGGRIITDVENAVILFNHTKESVTSLSSAMLLPALHTWLQYKNSCHSLESKESGYGGNDRDCIPSSALIEDRAL